MRYSEVLRILLTTDIFHFFEQNTNICLNNVIGNLLEPLNLPCVQTLLNSGISLGKINPIILYQILSSIKV